MLASHTIAKPISGVMYLYIYLFSGWVDLARKLLSSVVAKSGLISEKRNFDFSVCLVNVKKLTIKLTSTLKLW